MYFFLKTFSLKSFRRQIKVEGYFKKFLEVFHLHKKLIKS